MQQAHVHHFSQPFSQTTEHARYPATQSTSSAFSASANPNEDWTKISDLAERRRIQNRIAQRNYRKKLKRRLEDLEKKAVSTSPEPSHSELAVPSPHHKRSPSPATGSMGRQNSRASQASSTTSQDQQQSPELFPLDDPFANMTMQEHQLQYLSQPNYGYSPYIQSTDYFGQDFTFCGSQSTPQVYAEPHFQTEYTSSLPPTLPSMTQTEAIKQDPYSLDDDFLNPFGITYASLPGMDMNQHIQPEYQTRSPPSSDGWSSSGSRENSPPYFTQPMTPLSRSTSPNVHFFEQKWQL